MSLLTARETKLQILSYNDIPGPALLAWCALSNSMRIHELTLWGASDDKVDLLGSMPFLRALTIVNSSGFTGRTLKSQPNVSELTLIGCPHADAEGLKHMLAAALPAVQSLAFQASYASPVVQITQQTIEALVCRRNCKQSICGACTDSQTSYLLSCAGWLCNRQSLGEQSPRWPCSCLLTSWDSVKR